MTNPHSFDDHSEDLSALLLKPYPKEGCIIPFGNGFIQYSLKGIVQESCERKIRLQVFFHKDKKPVHPENLTGQAGFLFHKVVEGTALDRNSVSGPNQPRNTLKTRGFIWEAESRPKFPPGKQLFFPDFQAPDEDAGFATRADTKNSLTTNLIRFRKWESN